MKAVILDSDTIGVSFNLKGLDLLSYKNTKACDTAERVQDAEIIITNKVLITKEVIAAAKNLRLVAVAATGINNVDLEAARLAKVAVCNVAGYSTASVVEHTFALYFALARKLAYYNEYSKSKWQGSELFTHIATPYSELYGKRWGVIGLGEIGAGVAKIASAFGAEVVYYSTSGKNNNPAYRSMPLDALLKTCDVVSVHCALNEKTKDLLNYDKLLLMKSDAVLLNLARGKIINEQDLAKILEQGRLAGVGLDVLEKEPPEFTAHFKHERVLVTPHIAWASAEARKRLVREIEKNIESFLEGKIRNRVDI